MGDEMTPEEAALRKDIQDQLEGLMTRFGWKLESPTIPKASRSSWTGETRLAYRWFLALRGLIRDESIPVSHDPGANRRRKRIAREPVYVYFSHEAGDTNCWKIGRSKDPPKRVRAQTFNPRDVAHEFSIGPWPYEEGKNIEAAVLNFTENRHPKGRTKEWRNLSASYIHDLSGIVVSLATQISSQGSTALTSRYVRPKKRGVCPAKVDVHPQEDR